MNSVIMSEASVNQWDFWRIYRILRKRVWLILAAVIITVGTAVVGLQFFGRQYVAYRYVQPSENILRPIGARDEDRGSRERRLETLVQIARSPGVADLALAQTYRDKAYAEYPDRPDLAEQSIPPGKADVAILSDAGLTREEIAQLR
ncbi:MAG: hypothetical protein NZ520_10460, partial [bacterium]|nr:hypothetical protein [bacterium]